MMATRWNGLYESRDSRELLGVATGLRVLDGYYAGMQAGELVVLAGRPSAGKTSLALNIAANVAQRRAAVAVFSLEMSAEQLVDRLVCSAARINGRAVRTRSLSDEQWERAFSEIATLGTWPIHIDDRASTTHAMRAKAGRVKGLGLIIVDYLGMVEDERPKGERPDQHIGEIARRLKRMGQALHVPVLLLVQMSRKVEDRPGGEPQLSDLRDSGRIEEVADIVTFLWRKADDDAALVRGKVAKHRNGETGPFELAFDKAHTRFCDVSDAIEEGRAVMWYDS